MYPYVRSLRIRNFKGVAELDLAFDDSLTVLAGVNGVGKTSAIQAALGVVTRAHCVMAVHGLSRYVPKYRPPGDLVRYGASDGTISADVAHDEGEEFEFTFRVGPDGVAPDYPVKLGSDLRAWRDVALGERLSAVRSGGAFGEATPPPLIAYYDQYRIGGLARRGQGRPGGRFSRSQSPSINELLTKGLPTDIDGAADGRHRRSEGKSNRDQALDTTPHALSDFKTWFFEKEGDEAREARDRGDLEYEDPEVRAVQDVIRTVAGDAARLRSRKPDGRMDRELYVRQRNGLDVPFEALSGGEQAFFLLAVDLARRLILEFPGCPVDEAPGFVCIDEIELHLHPAWQREILGKLTGLFRGCQFLVSTHSPQVLGDVAARHIRLLTIDEDGRVEVRQPPAAKGRDSNYVLAGVLETVEQDPEVDRLFGEFDRLMDADRFDEADQVLDQLDELIEGGSPRITVRRAKCRRRRRTSQ